MIRESYRYIMCEHVSLPDAEETLNVALLAVQAVHGAARARLDLRFVMDESKRAFEIDADTGVGHDLNQIFVEYLTREFGHDSFEVCRLVQEASGAA